MTIRYFDFNEIKIWVFLLIIQINTSAITSKLVPIQKSDPTEWREDGVEANFAQFNSLYTILINEEELNSDKFCSGKCDSIDSQGAKSAQNLSYPNQCVGSLRHCWLERETDKRKKAKKDYAKSTYVDCSGVVENKGCFQPYSASEQEHYHDILFTTGNICKCLCERDDISNAKNKRGKLLDSICFDPVSVDNGYVATGARFRRRGNAIHLELQQGVLSQGKINPVTLKWKTSCHCNLKKKVITKFRNDGNYISLKIILDDLTLTENAVVTGVTLGASLRGRYVDDDGNINTNESEITQESQCHGSPIDLVHRDRDLRPSTALIGKTNYERSEPCDYKIIFGGTKQSSDNIQHVVPFVDLQEIVTDQNSPKPIHGISWYYRGYPRYGGYLALKIFTKE
ncbi:uncharacterized protein LOC130673677 [Microplitis mediator]|uniref:uncharacterized protein LOC130673677 n=1 Tax=Microplitis mediator TaxID=375433 RepID=UPI0025530244|nr:uncharacterized protein LOC130673677 [Microplitis mediator]